jgi:hypothetical protein
VGASWLSSGGCGCCAGHVTRRESSSWPCRSWLRQSRPEKVARGTDAAGSSLGSVALASRPLARLALPLLDRLSRGTDRVPAPAELHCPHVGGFCAFAGRDIEVQRAAGIGDLPGASR